MLPRKCGESVTPQRADVGIGPYTHYYSAAVNSNFAFFLKSR
ncbi:MAG: hypothetical protein ACI3W5_08745 [Faecousia sp.]